MDPKLKQNQNIIYNQSSDMFHFLLDYVSLLFQVCSSSISGMFIFSSFKNNIIGQLKFL